LGFAGCGGSLIRTALKRIGGDGGILCGPLDGIGGNLPAFFPGGPREQGRPPASLGVGLP